MSSFVVGDTYRYQDVANGVVSGDALRQSIEANGFVVLKEVFSPAEIARMREQARGYLEARGLRLGLGRTRSNVAADEKALAWVFGHDRIIQAINWSLDQSKVVFTGHSDAHMNMVAGWHKDSETRYGSYFSKPCIGAESCRVYKIGIYLQDHSNNNTGLKVRRGSHKVANLSEGELVTLYSGLGDIVIFDVRISHCGDLPDGVEKVMQKVSRVLKGRHAQRQDPDLFVKIREAYVKMRRDEQKMSIFFTFGMDNIFTSDFSRTNMQRQMEQVRLAGDRAKIDFPVELRERLSAAGIGLPDFTGLA
ncbi:hypothetical protein P7L68_22355 [Tistrella mobilis]|uniref:phytanoyl-CoA dioxygenase family protein n=1 Tax=Tistrella mobilis TaxID=171437 RepID=UPI003558A9D4